MLCRSMRARQFQRIAIYGAALILLIDLCAAPLSAADLIWSNPDTGVNSGLWSVGGPGGNWFGAPAPTANDDLRFFGGEAAISGSTTAVGRVVQIASFEEAPSGINWDVANPTDLHLYRLILGFSGGHGTFRMSNFATGRTLTLDSNLSLGFRDNSRGTYLQDRGTAQINSSVFVGDGSPADNLMRLSGTASFNSDTIVVADDGNTGVGGKGTLEIWDSATINAAGLTLGDGDHAQAVVKQYGGSFTVPYKVQIANDDENVGDYYLYGGAADFRLLQVANDLAAKGSFTQSGGTLTVREGIEISNASSFGNFFLQAGTINVLAEFGAGNVIVGNSGFGTGLFEQTGGELHIAGSLILSKNAPESTVTISDGALDVTGSLIVGQAGKASFTVAGSAAQIDVGGLTTAVGAKANATLAFHLDANGISPINVDGLVDLQPVGGTIPQLAIGLLDAAPLHDLVLVNNDGVDPINGIFLDLPDESLVTATLGGTVYEWRISYNYDQLSGLDGAGNDIALKFVSAVPEASTLVSGVIGALCLAAGWRRKIFASKSC